MSVCVCVCVNAMSAYAGQPPPPHPNPESDEVNPAGMCDSERCSWELQQGEQPPLSAFSTVNETPQVGSALRSELLAYHAEG